HEVLKSATDPNVLFAQIGIERADIPLGIDIQLNGRIGYFEKPGLSVVGTCGENSGVHERQRPVAGIAAPVFPRFVSRPLAYTKYALVVGAPDSTADDYDGKSSRAL